MERGFFLWFAAVMVSVAPGVKGTAHLSFANNTQVNITREGCGDSKLCLEEPTECDPAGNDTCLFGSVVLGADRSIQLRGESAGYIALGINASEGTTMLFVCAQNASDNGTFFFRTMKIDTDNQLSPQETRVTEIRGLVNSDVIQCEFDIPDVNGIRNSFETLTFLLGTGSFNGTTFGLFNISLSRSLNITVNTTATPTTAGATTAGASSVVRSYALLLLLSVVTLSVTQRA
ncbi:uncharacterized protein [Paralichthys olivaceus]|uniref:uncharacterized protein n=1 Tax=Paralichthys olivaceus TaxID=8255 RepID=UPI0037531536